MKLSIVGCSSNEISQLLVISKPEAYLGSWIFYGNRGWDKERPKYVQKQPSKVFYKEGVLENIKPAN